jgi:hypothetical protein
MAHRQAVATPVIMLSFQVNASFSLQLLQPIGKSVPPYVLQKGWGTIWGWEGVFAVDILQPPQQYQEAYRAQQQVATLATAVAAVAVEQALSCPLVEVLWWGDPGVL